MTTTDRVPLNLQPVLAVALLGSVFMPWWRA